MAERINHAETATNLLTQAVDAFDEGRNEYAALTIQAAQAQAVLAMVEQQRIANLIALSESGRATVNGARAALETLYSGKESEGTANMRLSPDIAAALGIGGSDA